jgi:AcrR family transcriptional regulator
MDAAISCFAEKGYYETSMDDIVRATGLSKGSLYWHFASKRDLFRSLLETWLAQAMAGLPERIAACTSASEKIGVLMDAGRDTVAVRPELARAQLEFMGQAIRDPEFREWFRTAYVGQRMFIAEILREGIERGEFRAVPIDSVARMVMAYADGMWLHREWNELGDDIGVLMEDVKATLLAVLRA